MILRLLCEGNGVRGISRIVGCSVNTVQSFILDLGTACGAYMHQNMQHLPCRQLELDEIWSFVYAKTRRLPEEMRDRDDVGTIWTWIAICRDTRVIPCFHVGGRDTEDATLFMRDLASRVDHRVTLYSDGHAAYKEAIDAVFGRSVDYGRLIKETENGRLIKTRKEVVAGYVDERKITTSYVERHNLMIRTTMRRFMRRTNGHSKKFENHCLAQYIHFFMYNYVHIHDTLKTTPARAAKIADRIWRYEDVVGLAI